MSELHPEFKQHSLTIPALFSVSGSTKGEVGLELETIGTGLPLDFFGSSCEGKWTTHPDASVKVRQGETAIEYVFKKPLPRGEVEPCLDLLHEEFKKHKSKVAEDRISNSVHVHLNAQGYSMQQVYTWLAVYFTFEELLVRWAGDVRVGNMFCLRARDAEATIKRLMVCAERDDYSNWGSKTFRYASVNTTALSKFGSLEFRALRGTVDKKVIMPWVDTLLSIKDAAEKFVNPTEVMGMFSSMMPVMWCRKIIPEPIRSWMLGQADFMSSVYEGARMAQDFCFATTWMNQVIKDNPKKKTANKEGTVAYTDTMNTIGGDWGITNPTTGFPTQAPPSPAISWLNPDAPFAGTKLQGHYMKPMMQDNQAQQLLQFTPEMKSWFIQNSAQYGLAWMKYGTVDGFTRRALAIVIKASGLTYLWVSSGHVTQA